MAFSEQSLADARQQGYSDDEIFNHLATSDERFSVAKKQGYSLDDIAAHFKQKEGGENNEGQTYTDSNAQRQADEQGQAGTQEGLYSSQMRLQEPQGAEERQRTLDSSREVGGDFSEAQTQETEGQRIQVGQEARQGLRGQVPSGNQAQVGEEGGVPSPSQGGIIERAIEDPASAALAAGASAVETAGALKAGQLTSKGIRPAGKFLLKQLVKKATGSVAAATAAPLSVAAGATGIGALAIPAIEMGAFVAGDWIAEKAFNWIESLVGADEAIEEAKARNPEIAQGASLAAMAPMAYTSLRNFKRVAAEEGKARAAQLAATGVAGGLAFEPIRYGIESALGAVTGAEEEPAPITAESLLESGLMGGVFAAHGAREIKKYVGPETAAAAVRTPTDATIEENAIERSQRKQFFTENQVMQKAEADLRSLEERVNAGEQLSENDAQYLSFLQSFPSAENIGEVMGFGVRKPSKPIYSTEEIVTDRLNEAQAKLAELDGKPDTKANQKKRTNLQADVARLQSDLAEGRTLEGQQRQEAAGEAPAKEQPPAEVTTPDGDIKQVVGGLSGGISDSIYKALWNKVTAGEVTELGKPSAILTAAKRLRELGGLTTIEEFRSFANEFDAIRELPKEQRLDALNALAEKYTKPAEVTTEAQPTKPSEIKEPKAGEIPTVEGESPLLETTIEAEEGVAPREGEGKEEVTAKTPSKAPYNIAETNTAEEARAWGDQKQKALSSMTGASAEAERLRIEQKVAERIEQIEATKEPKKIPYNIAETNTIEEARAWGDKKQKALASSKSPSAKAEIARIKQKVAERISQIESSAPKVKVAEVAKKAAPKPTPKEQGTPKAKAVNVEQPLPAKPKGTRVLAAAYRRKNPETGKMEVFYGANHQHALMRSGMSWPDIKKKYGSPEQRESKEFGYKTNTNKFVTRQEGEQVARASKQADNLGIDKDKQAGLSMHSNRLTLDEYAGPVEAGVSVGAARATGFEFGKADRDADLIKGAKIHAKGAKDFDGWKKQFLATEKGLKPKYTERQLLNLFEQSEKMQSYASNYKKSLEESIKDEDFWTGKTPEEIQTASSKRRTESVKMTNDNIDKLREERRLPPVMKEASKSWGSDWEEGMRRLDNDADYGDRLARSITYDMRVLSNPDKAVLAHQTLETMNRRDGIAELLAKETDPRMIEKYSREFDEADRQFIQLTELSSRVNSEAGRALNFIKTIIKSDYSLESLMTKAMAKNRRMGGDGRLTDVEKKNLSDLSAKVLKESEKFSTMLEGSKEQNAMNALMEFIEYSKGLRRVSIAEEQPTAKQEMERFTSILESEKNDPMSVGLAVRGLARAFAEKTGSTDPAKITDEVHKRIKNIMGDSWTKEQTHDALQGNGAFVQFGETSLKKAIQNSITQQKEFVDSYNKATKRGTAREREINIAKLFERRNIEFKSVESQMKSMVEEINVLASKFKGELDYELRSCE
ncbi:MAG: hypothetical protein AN484_06550 [Aphanizomenon flos-aquae WA102]|uniref:Uncharacterized protein n=1 Tax=Aphanizomenon flos-aquae WA102 TaxID=1710896 RepID=A0A1B7X5A2_APHFL|nr:MAG: hypothetical protein AN484_06550 [Aphanizomenon flos-aquae WA102]